MERFVRREGGAARGRQPAPDADGPRPLGVAVCSRRRPTSHRL